MFYNLLGNVLGKFFLSFLFLDFFGFDLVDKFLVFLVRGFRLDIRFILDFRFSSFSDLDISGFSFGLDYFLDLIVCNLLGSGVGRESEFEVGCVVY